MKLFFARKFQLLKANLTLDLPLCRTFSPAPINPWSVEVSNACRISISNKFPQGNDRDQPHWFNIWQISFIHFQRNVSRAMSCSAHGLSCFFSLSHLPGMCLSLSLTLVPGDLYSHCRAREWQGRKMPQQPLKQLSREANVFGLLLSIKFYGLELTGFVPWN